MNKYLNIVSLNVPYPPNYGGVIDIYYKIKALKAVGVKIILHCFLYNRPEAKELEELCEEVYYYKRRTGWLPNFSFLPYNVIGRKNLTLFDNLKKNTYPILFEGLYSCYFLSSQKLKGRMKIFRECNIEHDYFYALAQAEHSAWKRLYYLVEGVRFKYFEKVVKHADYILSVSQSDTEYLKQAYPNVPIFFIPCFHANDHIQIRRNKTDFILYHGNLSVAENIQAALFLIKHVFSRLPYRCIIAGMNPSQLLTKTAGLYPNISVEANPSEERMNELIRSAQIHTLITFQSTGLKLKLLNSLFNGKHIIANHQMLTGSGLENLCSIAETPDEIIHQCHILINKNIDSDLEKVREAKLFPLYSNIRQAERIRDII